VTTTTLCMEGLQPCPGYTHPTRVPPVPEESPPVGAFGIFLTSGTAGDKEKGGAKGAC
jgi:hypothetical protein